MTKLKKAKSSYDKLVESMNKKEKAAFENDYKELLISEMVIAAMKQDDISVRKLAAAAGVSPTIIQGVRSGDRKHISAQSLFKIFQALGYTIFAERGGSRLPLHLS